MLYVIIVIILIIIIMTLVGRPQPQTKVTDGYNVVIMATEPTVGQAVKPLKVTFRGIPLKEALRHARRASTHGHAAVLYRGRVVSAWCRGNHRGGLF